MIGIRFFAAELTNRVRTARALGVRTALATEKSDLGVVRSALADWARTRGPFLLVASDEQSLSRWMPLFGHAGERPAIALAGSIEESGDLHGSLLERAPFGAVLDVAGGADDERAERVASLVVTSATGSHVRILVDGLHDPADWLSRLSEPPAEASAIAHSAAQTISTDVRLDLRTATLEVERPHYAGFGEKGAERLLLRRTPRLRVQTLQTVPAASVDARARVIHHERRTGEPSGFSRTMDAPTLRLREYTGPMRWYSHMLLVHGQTALPPSFRFHHSSSLDNPNAKRVAPGLYRLKVNEYVRRREYAPLYDLSGGWPSHYGHFISQSVAKLWGWERAKEQIPELKAAVQVLDRDEHGFEEELLTAYGIDSQDIIWVDEPIRTHHMVSASLPYQVLEPGFIHPVMHAVRSRISKSLVDSAPAPHKRLFVSRTSEYTLRACRNQGEVEDLFRSAGFTIYYPEQHTVREQATAFHGAEVIAGFGGSAMFNLMHADDLKTLIVLSHESYTATNEYLLVADRDCDVHYFWNDADIAQPERGGSQAAFQSSWEFDFTRNRADLDALIESL
ncbi:MAG: glycosyltransferase family 61 protein [Microbacterium gubbeenense]